MKKKKSFRTKRGFTLVELVVTVGVLSIVAGMGVGIVASAIRNYSTASTTSSAQDTSLLIERFVVEAIRGSSKFDSASTDKTGKIEFSKSESAKFIYFDNGDLVTATSFVEKSGATPIVSKLYYSGVKSISFTPKRILSNNQNHVDAKSFIQVYYEIEMDEGYTLSGSTVMINADPSEPMTEWEIKSDGKYTHEGKKYELKNETSDDDNKKQVGVRFFS